MNRLQYASADAADTFAEHTVPHGTFTPGCTVIRPNRFCSVTSMSDASSVMFHCEKFRAAMVPPLGVVVLSRSSKIPSSSHSVPPSVDAAIAAIALSLIPSALIPSPSMPFAGMFALPVEVEARVELIVKLTNL